MNLEQVLNLLRSQLGTEFTVDSLKLIAIEAARLARDLLPGKTGEEKAAQAEAWLLAAVEAHDHTLPILGEFMDLPITDGLQKTAVRAAVAWGYAALVLEEEGKYAGPYPGDERGEVVGKLRVSYSEYSYEDEVEDLKKGIKRYQD